MDKEVGRDDAEYVRQQYASQDRLRVRVTVHERFTWPRVDFVAWVLDHLRWRGNEWIVDVGAGTGQYGRAAGGRCRIYVAADMYMAMLRDLGESDWIRLNLDAACMPLRSKSVDVVLANHMLYYVADLDQACAGFARILRPGGYLLAATNSERYMGELRRLHARIAARFGYADRLHLLDEGRDFTLENGRRPLAQYFRRVQRYDLASELRFPTAEPVVAYLASNGSRLFDLLPAAVSWDDVAAALRHELEAHIAEHGLYRVSKLAGVFVCQN